MARVNKVFHPSLMQGIGIRIGRFSVQTPLSARPGLGTQPRYEVPGDLRVELVENAVIKHRVSEAALSRMVQSFPRDSQIAVKKMKISGEFGSKIHSREK